MIVCKGCGFEFNEGVFCPMCGQRNDSADESERKDAADSSESSPDNKLVASSSDQIDSNDNGGNAVNESKLPPNQIILNNPTQNEHATSYGKKKSRKGSRFGAFLVLLAIVCTIAFWKRDTTEPDTVNVEQERREEVNRSPETTSQNDSMTDVTDHPPKSDTQAQRETIDVSENNSQDNGGAEIPPPPGGGESEHESETTYYEDDFLCYSADTKILGTTEYDSLCEKYKDEIPYFPGGRGLAQMIINEIYARHGKMYKESELSEYFNSKPWYRGKTYEMSEIEAELNQIEKDNVIFLVGKGKQEKRPSDEYLCEESDSKLLGTLDFNSIQEKHRDEIPYFPGGAWSCTNDY